MPRSHAGRKARAVHGTAPTTAWHRSTRMVQGSRGTRGVLPLPPDSFAVLSVPCVALCIGVLPWPPDSFALLSVPCVALCFGGCTRRHVACSVRIVLRGIRINPSPTIASGRPINVWIGEHLLCTIGCCRLCTNNTRVPAHGPYPSRTALPRRQQSLWLLHR
jgi:hypothetical protein